jgi:hypothetical protein
MNSKSITPGFLIIAGMIFIAAFIRLIPHPPNFAPVAAMALFGGAYFTKKWAAFLIPLVAMLVADLILGFHSTMWAVYLCFILIVAIGMVMIKQKKVSNIFLASISASVLFFVVTNFAVWAAGIYYPKDLSGLLASYTAAIPFFHYTLLGDLFFVILMFGSYELVKTKFPKLAEVKA